MARLNNKEVTMKAVNGLFCFYSAVHFIPGAEANAINLMFFIPEK